MNKFMNRDEIVAIIATRCSVHPNQARETVNEIFEAMEEVLMNDGRIEFRNFGVFDVMKRKERYGINPSTKERMYIPAVHSIRFHPSETLKKKVNTTLSKKSS